MKDYTDSKPCKALFCVIVVAMFAIGIWTMVKYTEANDVPTYGCLYTGRSVNDDPLQGYYYSCDINGTGKGNHSIIVSHHEPATNVTMLCTDCSRSTDVLYDNCVHTNCGQTYYTVGVIFLIVSCVSLLFMVLPIIMTWSWN